MVERVLGKPLTRDVAARWIKRAVKEGIAITSSGLYDQAAHGRPLSEAVYFMASGCTRQKWERLGTILAEVGFSVEERLARDLERAGA